MTDEYMRGLAAAYYVAQEYAKRGNVYSSQAGWAVCRRIGELMTSPAPITTSVANNDAPASPALPLEQ